jgi:hypothetical protein
MIETTWNNHYKVGYNGEWFNQRTSADDALTIDVEGGSRLPRGMNFEAVNAANIQIEKYGQHNICLMYSGGQDSEIVLLSFLASGRIPSKIVFLDYGENSYDLKHAEAFCSYYGIAMERMPIPAREMLLSGESYEVCVRNGCAQIGLSFYLKAIEELSKNYYVVTGDEPYIELLTNPLTDEKDWWFFVREPFYSLFQVFHRLGRDGCPNFIQYTPDLWLSYLDDPLMLWLRSQQDLTHSNAVKYDIYRSRFFTRPRHKSTGMEAFTHVIHAHNQQLMQRAPHLTPSELKYPFAKLHHKLTRHLHAYSTS